MSQVRLVAAEHGDQGELLGRSMFRLIYSDVLPYLDNESVIVAEGGKGRGKLTPEHPDYNIIYRQLGPICLSDVRPLIHSDDAIYHFQTPEQVKASFPKLNGYTAAIKGALSFSILPNSWDEMIARIRDDDHTVVVSGKLARKWRLFGKEESMIWKAREDLFIEQIMLYEKEERTVFFIGGVLHCVTLSARHGWPVIRLKCNTGIIQAFYMLWYVMNKAIHHF